MIKIFQITLNNFAKEAGINNPELHVNKFNVPMLITMTMTVTFEFYNSEST